MSDLETTGALPHGVHLFDRVADQVVAAVGDDDLKPGDRLPSERAMAQRFQVSRAVIREAIRTLCERGLLEARPKSGVYVKELDGKGASAQIRLLLKRHIHAFGELGEVRLTLEVDIAGLAAARATPEEIATLEETIGNMETHSQDADIFTENDFLFHTTLAKAAHNLLYLALIEPIQDLLMSYRIHSYHHQRELTIAAAMHHHRRILETIKARNPEAARQAMREHLFDAQGVLAQTE
jgi:GntR family transcriptional repressor for pyruvate dehydrogenase complex